MEQQEPTSVASENSQQEKLNLAELDISVPATLGHLPILCVSLREYCAALPLLTSASKAENTAERNRFGTGNLTLPGSHTTIAASYSHFVYSLELAVQEATSNIVRHGYGGDNPGKSIRMRVSVRPADKSADERQTLIIELIDDAVSFDTASANYTNPNPNQLLESGYGLYLIHKLVDKLNYFRRDSYNHLEMTKFFS